MKSSGVSVITFRATNREAGRRLDSVLAARFAFLSRSQANQLIRENRIRVNGTATKAAYLLRPNDSVRGVIPPLSDPHSPPLVEPEPISLDILFEDDQIIVLNKPPGVIVHPAPGHAGGTLVNALVYHHPDISRVGDPARPGIIHRLDKDTSGTLIVAKTAPAYNHLKKAFKHRQVQKQYLALVYGRIADTAGVIQTPVGRHPVHRKKMSTVSPRGRPAETEWRIRSVLNSATLIDVRIRTGRTHQIRVHCADMGHPVVGDIRYGGKKRWKEATASEYIRRMLQSVNRQMLHAWRLTCVHPSLGRELCFESPVPEDMAGVIKALQSVD